MTAKITEINKLSRLGTLGYFRPHGRLPFLGLVLGLRKLRNVIAGVPKGDEAATARQRYRIFETWITLSQSAIAVASKSILRVATACLSSFDSLAREL